MINLLGLFIPLFANKKDLVRMELTFLKKVSIIVIEIIKVLLLSIYPFCLSPFLTSKVTHVYHSLNFFHVFGNLQDKYFAMVVWTS